MKKNLLLTSVILASFALVGCNTPEPGPAPVEDVKVTGITTTEADINLLIGEQHALVYTVAPENATNKAVTFTEDSDFIDIVEGKVVGLAAGEAKVTATTADGGFTVEYNVVVKDAYAAFPKAEVEAFLATKNLEIEIPAYAAASADAYFEIDYDEEQPNVFTVFAVNTTQEEFVAYKAVLEAAEWYLYNENTYGDYIMCAGNYGERKAVANCVSWVDYVDEGEEPYVALSFTFMDPTTKLELSKLADEFKEYGIEDVVIPDYEGVDLDYEYDDEYGMHIVYTTTSEELAAWLADLVEAGWVLQAPEKEGQTYDAYKFGETRALLKILDLTGEYYQFAIVVDLEPLPGFPEDAVKAVLNRFEVTDEIVTLDDAEGYQVFAEFASIQVQATFDAASEASVLAAYQEALLVAGYTANENGSYTSPNGQFIVKPWLIDSVYGESYAGIIAVDFSVNLTLNAYINGLLAAQDVTDTFPELTVAYDDFYIVESSLQIQLTVAEGTEEASVATIAADLVAAGYTVDEDGYYNSPNGQISVYPWSYAEKYPGYAIINIIVNAA